ncbi:relaxase [Paraburkholderia guartelaensis]|uniref:Relaxase n=1 Tax=Paraburkholderia guartelaensis TaxID=2546446 RepID=A0A4R5L0T3_9BURK|nr:LPD7 domain-containing protein [Paraburkholderia guartelaensis]TDG02073.1 relaxase [Paraburkholderia guartelaensis]
MLIRVRGYHDGIKAYLEKGQKQDREFERDELDERVILAGDLDLTNSIIQSIDTEAERYINVTLSFKEDEVSRELLGEIVREFEAFAFAAYQSDEYNFYAEAHVPRLKSYADRRSGEFVERKVHVHVVIPEVNLLTGRRLYPFGKVDHNERFLEAFQEHINAKYGFASPKDNRRVHFTDASEMISRYKGDVFAPMNRELKAAILDAVLSRDVTHFEDFRVMLTEFGETRMRNAGRETEYENVKPAGAAKGVNLKEFVFSRAFIELDVTGKREALDRNVHAEYFEPGMPHATPRAYLDALAEWNDTRAREIKYLNSGSSFYKTYQAASPAEQRRILEHREMRFYDAAGGIDERLRRNDGGPGDWRDWRQPRWHEPERAQHELRGRWRRGADHDLDAGFDRPRAPARAPYRVRGVPGGGVDGNATRPQMLLPADALLELGNQQADRIDALRWSGDRERTGGEQLDPRHTLLNAIAARMYERWDTADDAGRARMAATAADKFARDGGLFGPREAYGLNRAPGGGRAPAEFGPRDEVCSLADVQSLDAIESMPFETTVAADTGAATVFNARARAATGREADTVRDQFARDLVEARAVRDARERSGFAEIRMTLDACRLLAALAHSHGLIVEKYSIGKGADGGDRIRAGSRNLNVSDFLTKEMNLSWAEAAQLLRDVYRAQTGRSPEHAPRRSPEPDLWAGFQHWRTIYRAGLRRAWDEQMQHEKARRGEIKATFYSVRNRLADRADLRSSERPEQLSAARVTRLEAEAMLRARIAQERDALKRAGDRPISDQYRDFLQERAQGGDERALRELRRMQQVRLRIQRPDGERSVVFSAPSRDVDAVTSGRNEIIYSGPSITYEVLATGEIEYRRDGAAFLVDEGRTLRLWDGERQALELALRLAQQKFGSMLSLSGPEVFRTAAARAAAELRMRVTFEQPELESIRELRSAELDAEAQDRRTAQRERAAWERDELRDIVRRPHPPVVGDTPRADQDNESPADGEAPDGGPETER